MARIMMKKAHNESISEAFEGFMLSAQSRGLTDKTLSVEPCRKVNGGARVFGWKMVLCKAVNATPGFLDEI